MKNLILFSSVRDSICHHLCYKYEIIKIILCFKVQSSTIGIVKFLLSL